MMALNPVNVGDLPLTLLVDNLGQDQDSDDDSYSDEPQPPMFPQDVEPCKEIAELQLYLEGRIPIMFKRFGMNALRPLLIDAIQMADPILSVQEIYSMVNHAWNYYSKY
jgi:hypothetical protein